MGSFLSVAQEFNTYTIKGLSVNKLPSLARSKLISFIGQSLTFYEEVDIESISSGGNDSYTKVFSIIENPMS